jgi:hypothetical protein
MASSPGPGEHVDSEEDEFEPRGVDGESTGWDAAKPAVFAGADAVLDPGVGAVILGRKEVRFTLRVPLPLDRIFRQDPSSQVEGHFHVYGTLSPPALLNGPGRVKAPKACAGVNNSSHHRARHHSRFPGSLADGW